MNRACRAALILAAALAATPAETSATTTAPSRTLADLAFESDAVLLATLHAKVAGGSEKFPSFRFVVKKVLKGDHRPGQEFELPGKPSAKPEELFLLTRPAGTAEWDFPREFSEAAFDYLAKAPPPSAGGNELPFRDRLPYYATFLERADPTIAEDAHLEFSNAPHEELAAARRIFPKDKLRGWVLAPETVPDRRTTYGVMLGLVGTDADAAALEEFVLAPATDFRIGTDGVMAGYLLLRGEPGLDRLQRLKLEARFVIAPDGRPALDERGAPVETPFSETYAAMQAVRFMWTYGDGRIGTDRLRRAMRSLLARPELADLAINDLARWKDWEAVDRIAGLYDDKSFHIPAVRRAIVRYLMAAEKDHAAGAKRHLSAIRRKDPKTVETVLRFLRPSEPPPADVL